MRHRSKMNCLFILLHFLPFAFGGILEPDALSTKKYDFLESSALTMEKYDFLEPSTVPTKRYDILSNGTFSDLHWPIEDKPVPVCNLVCQYIYIGVNLWICKWKTATVSCRNVTREIMKNAETIDPEMPYLMNASSSSKFGIGFWGNMGRVSNFDDGFLSDYSQLYAFWAQRIPIKKISKHTFEGVQKMFFLCLDQIPFLNIELGSFQNMSSLEILCLINLTLSRIDKNMFKGLHSLKHLELEKNNISKIEANSFIYLHSLDALMLNANPISNIHEDAFMGFKGTYLLIEATHISSSDLNSIRNLSSLRQLQLDGNRIKSIDSDLFKNLPLLYRVYLQYNPILSFPTGILNHSNNLFEIGVGCGRYPEFYTNLTLERASFATKTRVNLIIIEGCVTEIKPSAFKGLNAHGLGLQFNPELKRMKRNFFEGMTYLYDLRTVANGIEIVDSDTFHDPLFKKLVNLDLSVNKIKTIEPQTFHNLKNLKSLELSNNSITVITQNTFEGLQSLTSLFLYFNGIHTIDKGAFSSLNSLVLLNLSHNCITTLSDISFKGLEGLKHLDISYNRIEKISSGDLEYDFKLDTLLLQGNNIQKIYPAWSSLRLELFDLSQNHLTDVDFFRDAKSKKIILSQNKLLKIDQHFLRRTAVLELLLDHNNISDVSFIVDVPVTVNHLDLRYNEIVEVSITEIHNLRKIDKLHIDHNPWKCSCKESDRPLMNFLVELRIISCCPMHCKCYQTEDKWVDVNCASQNKSSLPTCLPYVGVKLYYSKNLLPNLTLTRFHENVTHLDLNHNLVTNIDGTSFTLLRNLTYLDLRSNFLKRVPHQFEDLKATKIYLEGNDFLCNDCNLVNTLTNVGKVTPQNFSCRDKQTFKKASFICLLKKIAPYLAMSVGIIALISGLYLFFNKLYMKRLSKRYNHRFSLLRSKKEAQEFKHECRILRDLDHLNICKMYKFMITRIPRRIGHFYLEKIDCSLREASSGHASLNMPELTGQLMQGIQFLHSRDKPIFIRNLSVDSILLQRNHTASSWILKIGDFSKAIIHVPTETADEETPLTTSADHDVILKKEDLQGAAHVVYFLMTHREKDEPITMQDLKEEPDIEMSILILSLQNGMTATEALVTAPFHLSEQRVSNFGELNQIFKSLKRTRDKSLGQAEENACLVIGGKGAWNKYCDLSLLEDFALLHDGYDITSYVCLLRFIRNILQHGHENPGSMETAFNTKTPSPKQILQKFSKHFPFFYLRSVHCLNKFTDERNSFGPDLYMTTYQAFENYICHDGVSTGAILPLQDNGSVSIHYKAPCKEFQETIFVEGTRSCIYLKDILPQIYEKSQKLWTDVSSKELFFKHHEKVILNPSDLSDATTKQCIPEGSSLQVLKPEVKIQLSDQVVMKRFKKNDMVKSLKGFSTKFLPPAMRKKEMLKSITVTLDDKQLEDGRKILDLVFADHAFVVRIS